MATAAVQDTVSTHVTPQQATEAAVDILRRLQRDVECLNDTNKVQRRRAVERLTRATVDCSPPLSTEALSVIYECLYKPVLKLFSDEVDRTRELAVDLTCRICSQVKEPEQYLPYIIPTIHQRLAGEEIKESTEEIRLLLVEILSKLCNICGGETTGVYINELVQILQKCILDPFAEVRKLSCKYTCELATATPQRFYQQGESLIEPLLKALSHQHNKVRTTVLKTIGVVVLATSGKAVNDVFTHIAQRTFDHSPTVRLMVTEVAGEWILKLRDRYSFFQKLIPLLLSGFSDEMPDIEAKSKDFYRQAGELYERENEEELRDQMEYRVVKHYEHLVQHDRPNLGCRTLVQRHFSKILPGIVNDLTDWNAATRVKTSALMYWLVLHCEDHITMNIQLLSEALYSGALDDEEEVVTQVLKTAKLVGLFVEPSIYCKMILPRIESSTSPRNLCSALAVLASYVSGSNFELLAGEVQAICSTLELPEVCSILDASCQKQVLSCVEALISKTGINHTSVGCKLFNILLNILSLSEQKDEIRKLLDQLATMLGMEDRGTLFGAYTREMLESLKESCADWTSQSSQCLVFVTLLSESHTALVGLLGEVIPMLVSCCDVGRDPEMRQKMLTMMSYLVTNPTTMNDTLRDELRGYAVTLVKEVVLPNCVWVAGRTAAAIRAIAVSFLWALLQSSVVTAEHLTECFTDLHTQLTACLDCHNPTTRLVSIKVMLKLLQCCKESMDVEVLHVIYPEVLKRMNDTSDEVRILTARTISAFFQSLPQNYDRDFFRAHLEVIYKTMLLHMDDTKEDVQKECLDCLKTGARVHPGLLKRLVEDVVNKHRNKNLCEELKVLCCSLLKQQQEEGAS